MPMRHAVLAAILLATVFAGSYFVDAQVLEPQSEFWASRDTVIERKKNAPAVRIGIWDSGVDVTLFPGQIAQGVDRKALLRGYNSFKLREDTAMEVLPSTFATRRDELNRALKASDDMADLVASPNVKEFNERRNKMSAEERREFDAAIGRWSGYVHGTAVADIAVRGNKQAQIVIARMEWWHGSPPVPCWNRELADREADSIRDLLTFLVSSGARVVNMSWGRFEASYLSNLRQCAPEMTLEDRQKLARYTVEKIRGVLQEGMKAAPNVLFVGAAGNSGTSVETANPATRFTLPNFILVGAVDRSGKATQFTNKGPEVTLYANGERVPARLPGGEVSYPSGTSMATPNVTNAAAKMLAVNPRLNGGEMRILLEQTGDKNSTGQLLLHTARAVEAARQSLKAKVAVPASK
ncbi:MAG: S8 family serine peptidase [Chloracidobacterium sp.]|nr:S8 family serine peptidase [Chloracidobacterium sp.]